MRVSANWHDYELIDASNGERLERWGDIILVRPDPQVIWKTARTDRRWNSPHARYIRSKSGGGRWEIYKSVPDTWKISYQKLAFNLKLMGFKHTGLFPEQAVNWDFTADIIKKSEKQLKVLNLFAYTGGATLACLAAGAQVTHVDASKGMVATARENAAASRLDGHPARWLVDDCLKFVKREIRRGNKYDGIIMDPPSYGRGPGGEVWQIENMLHDFLCDCSEILAPDARFLLLNSYTTGFSHSAVAYMLGEILDKRFGGQISSDEIGLTVKSTGRALPCGSTVIWTGNE